MGMPTLKDDEYQSTAIYNLLPVIVCESRYDIVMPYIHITENKVCVCVFW